MGECGHIPTTAMVLPFDANDVSAPAVNSEPRGEIAIRSYRNGDEQALTSLFESVFGRRMSEREWRWKLAPTFKVPNVWLATHSDRPIFQYAAMHTRFKLDERAHDVMVSVDTMTAPAFRRRGLLTEVATRAYEAWRDAGIAFVIGLPNQQWGSRANALGWRELFPLQWLARPLRPEALIGRRLGLPGLGSVHTFGAAWNRFANRRLSRRSDVEVTQVESAGAEFDVIWDRCRADTAFSAVRDSEWIERRFMSSPARNYQVLVASERNVPTAWLTYSVNRDGGRTTAQLTEILAKEGDSASSAALMLELLRRLREHDADLLYTLAVPGSPLFAWFRSIGFIRGPSFGVQLVPLATDVPLERFQSPRAWRITGADFDVA
jgi:GNAT acetyltransferase-like protein